MRNIIIFLLVVGIGISCKTKSNLYNDPIPEHDSFIIGSSHVNEDRVINVWLPPNYNTSSEKYPVLYMPDGGINEDFPHIANTLRELISDKKVPAFILVGIENTDRRRDLTGYSESAYDKQFCPVTDGAADFRAFINKELMPEIDKKYRTTDRKGIIGESLAGLFVMETFFLQPNTFDIYIAMDPSIWWNDHYYAKNVSAFMSNFPNRDTKLWFAGSDAEDIYQYTRMVENALMKNTPQGLKWKYSDEPNEQHNTIYRATKERALIWSLNN